MERYILKRPLILLLRGLKILHVIRSSLWRSVTKCDTSAIHYRYFPTKYCWLKMFRMWTLHISDLKLLQKTIMALGGESVWDNLCFTKIDLFIVNQSPIILLFCAVAVNVMNWLGYDREQESETIVRVPYHLIFHKSHIKISSLQILQVVRLDIYMNWHCTLIF